MKKKCGVSPTVRMSKCPVLTQNRDAIPDSADCQGCAQGVETGNRGGHPTIKKGVPV